MPRISIQVREKCEINEGMKIRIQEHFCYIQTKLSRLCANNIKLVQRDAVVICECALLMVINFAK